jgi:uncharacterized protein (DUF885 family)
LVREDGGRDAKTKLASRFDLRDFHQVFMIRGMPLAILARVVNARIAETLKG